MIKLKIMRLIGYVTLYGKMRNSYTISKKNLNRTEHLGHLGTNGKPLFKKYLKETGSEIGVFWHEFG